MKEIIEYLKERIASIKEYNEPMSGASWGYEEGCVISGHDAQKVIDFYEKTANIPEYTEQELNCKSGCMGPCGQCKDEPPNAPDITPEWSSLDEKFQWVAIDPDGVEIAFIRKPQKLQKYMHGCNAWTGRNCQSTGRFIDMKGIDWTKTLSKRPAK